MRTAVCSIAIDRPPEALFDFMLRADTGPEWRDYVSHMEWIDPPARGAKARLMAWVNGKEFVQEVQLVEYDRPRSYTFQNHNGGYLLTSANRIEPDGAGSEVTLTVDVVGDTVWAGLLLPLISRRHKARFQKTLERLKRAAEQVR